jgi:hypothetical protein
METVDEVKSASLMTSKTNTTERTADPGWTSMKRRQSGMPTFVSSQELESRPSWSGHGGVAYATVRPEMDGKLDLQVSRGDRKLQKNSHWT